MFVFAVLESELFNNLYSGVLGDLSGDASIVTVNTKVTSNLGSLSLFFFFPVGASGIRLSPFYFNLKCI